MSRKKGAAEAKRAREELAGLYRQVYDRCMEGEVKGFDAKGALSALERLEHMRGMDGAEQGAQEVTLKLAGSVGDRGD